MPQKLSCPSCHAPLNIKHRFVKMVTCDFCGQVSLLKDSGLDPTGQTAKLAMLPSPLYVDATGELQGKRFRIMGRLRYQYDAGLWDEWFLVLENDKPGWLVEDEGEYRFYVKQTLTSSVLDFDDVRVGSTLSIAGHKVFITEKGRARIAGGEGQLAFAIIPGERVNYVDGNSGDKLVSLEYTEDEIELSFGRAVAREDLKIDEEEF